MVYLSKKRGLKGFFKTGNLKYYIAFFVLFLAVIAVIIIVSRRIKPDDDDINKESDIATEDKTTEAYTDNTTTTRGVYKICVNKSTYMISVYAYDEKSDSYSDSPARCMLGGIGDLDEGTYSSGKGAKSSWSTADNGFYRYYSDFGNDIVFHSALYNVMNDKNSLNTADYAAIGSHSENKGITLLLADAKWIYENCSFESEIVVYQKADEEIDCDFISPIDIPEGITWEPTDTSDGSVWCQSEITTLDCAAELTVETGSDINSILSHVNARNKAGESVISYVYIIGEYNLDKAGTYNISLNLIDVYGNYLTRAVELTVEKSDDDTTGNDETEIKTISPTETLTESGSTEHSESSAAQTSDGKQETTATISQETTTEQPAETTTEEETETTEEETSAEFTGTDDAD